MNPKQILLPTDFSTPSLGALERGFDLCRQFRATPHFVHVLSQLNYTPMVAGTEIEEAMERIEDHARAAAKKRLEEIASHLVDENTPPATTLVLGGQSVTKELCDYAKAQDIDLLVMGSHGRSGVKRMVLGSEAERLVRLAPCSVMTVGPEVSIVPERPLRIVGALDLDRTTDRVIESVKALCELYAADPYFIHIVAPPVISGPYDTVTVMPKLLEELLESARTGMQKALRKHQLGEQTKSSVREGRPDLEIRKYGEEVEADLLVVSTHSRRGLSYVLLGSVAERVVRTAKFPVLVLREDEDIL